MSMTTITPLELATILLIGIALGLAAFVALQSPFGTRPIPTAAALAAAHGAR